MRVKAGVTFSKLGIAGVPSLFLIRLDNKIVFTTEGNQDITFKPKILYLFKYRKKGQFRLWSFVNIYVWYGMEAMETIIRSVDYSVSEHNFAKFNIGSLEI